VLELNYNRGFSAPAVQDISKLSPFGKSSCCRFSLLIVFVLKSDLREASYKDTRLKLAIRKLAPSVVSVSHFTGNLRNLSLEFGLIKSHIMKIWHITGVHRRLDCSGFIIDWDDSKGIATVLTSAKLMRSPSKRDNYYVCMPFTSLFRYQLTTLAFHCYHIF
jgi:hypothetical protein